MSSLPETWTQDRLKDVAVINARALSANTDPDYEFEYLEISNVDYHGVIDPQAIERLRFEDAPSRARRRVGAGDTVISSVRPNLQAVAFVPDSDTDLICSTGFNVVQALRHRLLPKFAYYVLVSEAGRQYFEATAKGVGYPAVDDRDFGAFPVPIPSLQEQQRIAAYLDASCAAVDAAIGGKRQQIDALHAVRDSFIERAVTRGISPGVTSRPIGLDWIANCPAHWTVSRIKRVVTRVDYGISKSTESTGRYPVLKMGHIQRGEIIFRNLDFVDEVAPELLLEAGDMLYNRTNSPDQVGKAAIFRQTGAGEITFASYLVRLRLNHRADPSYFNYLVNCDGFLAFARKLAIPSVQQSNLNSTRYCRMLIPLPPIDEQRRIADYLDEKLSGLAAVVANIESQIDRLAAYRKSLIHECVTGQRRVTEADVLRAQAHG